MKRVDVGIMNVKDFLGMEQVEIPRYQRPYKWTEKNVHQLIDDVQANLDKSAYRLGTIVFYRKDNQSPYQIVDGQQRAVTITLLALAINSEQMESVWQNRPSSFCLSGQTFSQTLSRENICANYHVIKERISEFDLKTIEFLLNKCEFVKVVLSDISEAFQFFDSQNARGKDLEPHDLLKAFHLREMHADAQDVITKVVSDWERISTEDLSELFEDWLFHVRNWSQLCSARWFTKEDVAVFKGVNLEDGKTYPYERLFRTVHYFVDCIEGLRLENGDVMDFPFQLDQTVINGRRFFEMVAYYRHRRKELGELLSKESHDIWEIVESYEGRGRDGDRYVRNMFDCACLYYWDKFGKTREFAIVIKQIFLWAYAIRQMKGRVSRATVDNYATHADGMFQRIRQALRPLDLAQCLVSPFSCEKEVDKVTEYFAQNAMLK